MTEQLWWYVARAGGIVALFLAGASVLWGLLLSSGFLDRNPGKKWLLGLHRWLGGLTVSFSALHVVALWLDSYIQYSLVDLVVPFASAQEPGRWALATGVVTFHLLAAVQVTSLLMRRLPRRLWRVIHLSSFGLFVTGIAHGFLSGTDAGNPLYLLGVVAMALGTVFLGTYRVLTKRPRRQPLAVAGTA